MEKNISEDIDSSFELFDPIVTSISDSMSIVAIPEDIATNETNGRQLSNGFQSNERTNSFNDLDNEFNTKRMDSMDETDLPNYDQIQEQEFLAQKMANIGGSDLSEERKASLQTLSDNLNRIEDNVKNCNNNLENILTNNLEIYLKELRDENEKLKNELEKNNQFMKQQLKNLHEWQTKNREIIEEHKRISHHSKQLSEENYGLGEENNKLKDRVTQLEAMVALKPIQDNSTQVTSLGSQQLSVYEKLNLSSELKSHEMTSNLVEFQLKTDAMSAEINGLRSQLSDANRKLETMSAMESQLYVFERDFKLEEMSKEAALKEVTQLEEEVQRLKKFCGQLEERLEKGEPVVDLKPELTVGKHHRRSRRSGKLGRHSIPVLNVGAVLKGFKRYNTTSSDV